MTTKINGYDVTHIDTETGEIICQTEGCTEIKDDKLSDSELKRKEYLDSHDMNFNKGEKFVKMYVECVYHLAQKLSAKEFSVAMALARYVEYETCIVCNGYGKGKHYMDLHEIAKELDTDYSRMTRIVGSLIAKGVMGEFKTGDVEGKKVIKYYIVNPFIYSNGSHPENDVIEHFFKNSGWKEFIENWQLTIHREHLM